MPLYQYKTYNSTTIALIFHLRYTSVQTMAAAKPTSEQILVESDSSDAEENINDELYSGVIVGDIWSDTGPLLPHSNLTADSTAINSVSENLSNSVSKVNLVDENEAKDAVADNDAQERRFYALYKSLKDKDYVKLKTLVTDHEIDINHTFTESFVDLPYRGWKLIHIVCKEGNIIGLEVIVSLGANTSAKTPDGESPLLLSFKNGHYDCVRHLVKISDSIEDEETSTEEKSTDKPVISVAVSDEETFDGTPKFQNVDTEKAEVNYNALYESLKDKDYEKLAALVNDSSVDINHTFTESFIELPYRGWRLIHFVCKRGNIDGLEVIISLGADPSAKTRNGDTALHISCKHGHYNCVKYLLKVSDYLKDVKNSQGLTPLMKALFRCDTVFKEKAYRKTIQVLIDGGCDVNLCPDSNVSPLHVVAGKWNSSYLMGMLIKAGGNVSAVAGHRTPLMTGLCRHKIDTAAVKLLIDSGSDVDYKNQTGKSLLHIAVSKSEDKCVEYLLQAGANPNIEDDSGDSPLWIAVCENNIKIAPLLIKYGGNVNFRNTPYKMSLLCNAANRRYRKMVELLLDNDVNVNAETALGASALHYAVDQGEIEIVKMLLQRNCNMDNYSLYRDVYNPHNVFQIALEEGEDEIIKLLCEAGCPIPEYYVRPDRLPRAVKDNEELIDWLYKFYYNPPSLLHICRLELRGMYGSRLHDVVDGLLAQHEIPHRLADCILMKDLLE